MSLQKRLSITSNRSQSPLSPGSFVTAQTQDAQEWIKEWEARSARDMIDSPVVEVEMDCSVEDACDKLLSENVSCLAIRSPKGDESVYIGLFDYTDVNAFLTLAATRHTVPAEELQGNADRIVAAAKAGRVPVHLVSNLSQRNALEAVPYDANVIDLLRIFSTGCHRVLVQDKELSSPYLGLVSDRSLLAYLSAQADRVPSLQSYFGNVLQRLPLPSLALKLEVVACTAEESTLTAMRSMDEEGVSSVPVLEGVTGALLNAVSVTDIAKTVVPAQNNEILSMPLRQFIAIIRAPLGSTDGEERYPVYSVLPTSTLAYTAQKLLATNAHRLFVTSDPTSIPSPTPTLASPNASSHLMGVVSIVDILSLFARIANIPGVDPQRMQRHRRASSSSTRSSRSGSRSRSSTGLHVTGSPASSGSAARYVPPSPPLGRPRGPSGASAKRVSIGNLPEGSIG